MTDIVCHLEPRVQDHCWWQDKTCCKFLKKRGSCHCGQFLLALFCSEARVCADTWTDVLTTKLEGIPHYFWGCETLVTFLRRSKYFYVIVFEVGNKDDCDRIYEIIDREDILPCSAEFADDRRPWVSCNRTCCAKSFFTQLKTWYSNFDFGDGRVFRDLEKFYSEYVDFCEAEAETESDAHMHYT